ncbi:galactose oxidase precursor protein [Rutstroemia sp. NJR-2017a BBW]|nr:galactose oxidase precursor protein [Rutstroemia sp. NJR-2017a BBW]
MSLAFDGKAIITGGDNADKTSIYISSSDTWVAGPAMKISRGYQFAPMLTADAQGAFRTDNHGWLFAWKNGSVFQAGPSKAMNWYGTAGTGSQVAAGSRASDTDSMCGNAALYDAVNGKIFTAGGSPSYQDSNATKNVHLITIGAPNVAPTVQTLTSMSYARAFANSVILPNGKVMVTGGQPYAAKPRTYHSIALLMLDGRVFTGGGGLCGSSCATNHKDAQIYSPSYLFNDDGTAATRPVISSITSTVAVGYGSNTHTVNTDQRRIALTPVAANGTTYTFTIPADPGVALPGYWMFWAMNSAGVPSLGGTVKITL